uniref:hypothetical protein n=1 Tax=Bartonella sp. MR168JLCBS TaxID=3243556 RepID=UPI0035D0A310
KKILKEGIEVVMSAFQITFIAPYYIGFIILMHVYLLELVLLTLYYSLCRNSGPEVIRSEIEGISSVRSDKRAQSWLTRTGHARVSSDANPSLMRKRV